MNDTVEKQILATLQAIEKKPNIPITVARWNSAACAEFLQKSPKYFLEHIACRPDFPEPNRIKLPGKRKGQPLWKASEVIKWLDKQ